MIEFGCGSGDRSFKGACKRPYIKEDYKAMKPNQLEPSLTDLVLKPKSKKIARPPNAFMLFARDHRKSLAMKHPNHNNKHISSLLGESWRKADEDTKNEYFKKSKLLEGLHKKMYPGYVYSPRIARIQKLARKKKTTCKCNDDNYSPSNDEVFLECSGPGNTCNNGDEKCSELNESILENRPSSPGYVPNNPQYFSEPEREPQPEMTCTAKNNTQSYAYSSPPVEQIPMPCSGKSNTQGYAYSSPPVEPIPMPCSGKSNTQGYVYPSCLPPSRNSPPMESMPCSARYPSECRSYPGMYAESCYLNGNQSEIYDYGSCNRYPDYPYEPATSSAWSTFSEGCEGDWGTIHSNDEYGGYSYFLSSQVDFRDSYSHYNSSAPYQNHPYPYNYGHYRDIPMPYRPRHFVSCNSTPPRATSSSYFPKSMNYYNNQYQPPFQDNYPKFSCPTQPMDYPTNQETISSNDVYQSEVYENRAEDTEEQIESNNFSQSAEFVCKDVDQQQTGPDGDEIIDVVTEDDEKSNILTEEEVETANPEFAQ